MKTRPEIQDELNRMNELYQQADLDLKKAGASIEQRQRARDLLNKKKTDVLAQGDDLTKLNAGKSIGIQGGTISTGLDQSDLPDMAKQVGLGKEGMFSRLRSKLGKKALSVIPGVGAIAGLASGEPAMAAEEAVGDIPLIGQGYEAIKSESAGMSPEEEDMMLADIQAKKNYANSPAARARKLLGK